MTRDSINMETQFSRDHHRMRRAGRLELVGIFLVLQWLPNRDKVVKISRREPIQHALSVIGQRTNGMRQNSLKHQMTAETSRRVNSALDIPPF